MSYVICDVNTLSQWFLNKTKKYILYIKTLNTKLKTRTQKKFKTAISIEEFVFTCIQKTILVIVWVAT